jgi:hypothetical protein
MDRVCKICLILIVVLLAVVALRLPISQSVRAAQPRTYAHYRINMKNLADIDNSLTNYSRQGFEVVGVTSFGEYHNEEILFILAK